MRVTTSSDEQLEQQQQHVKQTKSLHDFFFLNHRRRSPRLPHRDYNSHCTLYPHDENDYEDDDGDLSVLKKIDDSRDDNNANKNGPRRRRAAMNDNDINDDSQTVPDRFTYRHPSKSFYLTLKQQQQSSSSPQSSSPPRNESRNNGNDNINHHPATTKTAAASDDNKRPNKVRDVSSLSEFLSHQKSPSSATTTRSLSEHYHRQHPSSDRSVRTTHDRSKRRSQSNHDDVAVKNLKLPAASKSSFLEQTTQENIWRKTRASSSKKQMVRKIDVMAAATTEILSESKTETTTTTIKNHEEVARVLLSKADDDGDNVRRDRRDDSVAAVSTTMTNDQETRNGIDTTAKITEDPPTFLDSAATMIPSTTSVNKESVVASQLQTSERRDETSDDKSVTTTSSRKSRTTSKTIPDVTPSKSSSSTVKSAAAAAATATAATATAATTAAAATATATVTTHAPKNRPTMTPPIFNDDDDYSIETDIKSEPIPEISSSSRRKKLSSRVFRIRSKKTSSFDDKSKNETSSLSSKRDDGDEKKTEENDDASTSQKSSKVDDGTAMITPPPTSTVTPSKNDNNPVVTAALSLSTTSSSLESHFNRAKKATKSLESPTKSLRSSIRSSSMYKNSIFSTNSSIHSGTAASVTAKQDQQLKTGSSSSTSMSTQQNVPLVADKGKVYVSEEDDSRAVTGSVADSFNSSAASPPSIALWPSSGTSKTKSKSRDGGSADNGVSRRRTLPSLSSLRVSVTNNKKDDNINKKDDNINKKDDNINKKDDNDDNYNKVCKKNSPPLRVSTTDNKKDDNADNYNNVCKNNIPPLRVSTTNNKKDDNDDNCNKVCKNNSPPALERIRKPTLTARRTAANTPQKTPPPLTTTTTVNWSTLSQTAIQNTKNNAMLAPLLRRIFSTLSPSASSNVSETIPLMALSAFKSSPNPSLGSLAAVSIFAAAKETMGCYGDDASAFDVKSHAIPENGTVTSPVMKRTRLASIVGMNAMKHPHCDERTAKIAISTVLKSAESLMGSSTREILDRASRRAYERVVIGFEGVEEDDENEMKRVAMMGETVVVSILMAGGEGWWDMTSDKTNYGVVGRGRGDVRDGGYSGSAGRRDDNNNNNNNNKVAMQLSPRLITKTKTMTNDDDDKGDDGQHNPADLRQRHRQTTPSLLVSTTTTTPNGHQNYPNVAIDDERSRSLSTSSNFDWNHVTSNLSSFVRKVSDPWSVAQPSSVPPPPPLTTTAAMEPITTTPSSSSSNHYPMIATARLAPITPPPTAKTSSMPSRSCLLPGASYNNGTTTPTTTNASSIPNWTRIAHDASRYVAKSGGSHQAAKVAESTVYDVCCRRVCHRHTSSGSTANNDDHYETNNNDGINMNRDIIATGEAAKELLNIAAVTASKRVFEMGMDATEAGIVTVAILKGVNAIPP